MTVQDELRNLPSVDSLLQLAAAQEWERLYGRMMVVESIRQALSDSRSRILQGQSCPPVQELSAMID